MFEHSVSCDGYSQVGGNYNCEVSSFICRFNLPRISYIERRRYWFSSNDVFFFFFFFSNVDHQERCFFLFYVLDTYVSERSRTVRAILDLKVRSKQFLKQYPSAQPSHSAVQLATASGQYGQCQLRSNTSNEGERNVEKGSYERWIKRRDSILRGRRSVRVIIEK